MTFSVAKKLPKPEKKFEIGKMYSNGALIVLCTDVQTRDELFHGTVIHVHDPETCKTRIGQTRIFHKSEGYEGFKDFDGSVTLSSR